MTRGNPAAQDAAVPQTNTNPFTPKLIEQALDALSLHTRTNPDHLLSLKEFPRISLESPSFSGGKFWIGVAMETGVSIRWGKLGTQGTVRHFALAECRNNDPVRELKTRVLRKINKGYDIVPHETKLP